MIRFTKSGLSDLSLPNGRSLPSSYEYEPNQIANLTEDGHVKVVKFGTGEELIDLQFEGLTRDNFDGVQNGLKTWFASPQIDFMMNTFTMIDENGESRTVRLRDSKFKITQNEYGLYSLKITLKVE